MVNVTFLHPDLGIGGAERLIVDAALGLKRKGHKIRIITTHHDKNRCFEETRNGELDVFVVGDWIPRSIFNKFYALMAYLRMIYAAFYLIFSEKSDVIICDLVSVAIPVLKLKFSNVIFYCHHPDLLLSQPGGSLKRLYRAPLNYLEEISTGKATRIFINSKYTGSVFKNTFKRLSVTPDILYPSLNTEFFDKAVPKPIESVTDLLNKSNIIFLSINRYERKKNLNLAISSFSKLKSLLREEDWNKVHLIIAGGYDSRVEENIQHFTELETLSSDLQVNSKIIFFKSPTDSEKLFLINSCTCLLYTPSFEHFGIVPIEAMYMKKPVIAVNNGGPTETIVNGETGFLCESSEGDFSEAMSKFAKDKMLSSRMGETGRKRVIKLFSFEQFSKKLDEVVKELVEKKDE